MLGVLVILAFALSSAYDAWRSYRNTLTATDREISNMANALAEQSASTLQAVDLLLLDTARWYRNDSHGLPPERLNEILAKHTGQRLEKVERDVERDFIMNAEQGKEYGIIDDIIYKHK